MTGLYDIAQVLILATVISLLVGVFFASIVYVTTRIAYAVIFFKTVKRELGKAKNEKSPFVTNKNMLN